MWYRTNKLDRAGLNFSLIAVWSRVRVFSSFFTVVLSFLFETGRLTNSSKGLLTSHCVQSSQKKALSLLSIQAVMSFALMPRSDSSRPEAWNLLGLMHQTCQAGIIISLGFWVRLICSATHKWPFVLLWKVTKVNLARVAMLIWCYDWSIKANRNNSAGSVFVLAIA